MNNSETLRILTGVICEELTIEESAAEVLAARIAGLAKQHLDSGLLEEAKMLFIVAICLADRTEQNTSLTLAACPLCQHGMRQIHARV